LHVKWFQAGFLTEGIIIKILFQNSPNKYNCSIKIARGACAGRVYSMRKYFSFVFFTGLLSVSCTKKDASFTEDTLSAPEIQKEREPEAEQMRVSGLKGKIDDSIIEQTFNRNTRRLLDCYKREAIDVLEEIEGRVDVFFIVDANGNATDEIYFESGTLGSDATQECLISVIKSIRFQKPIGGYQAEVRYSIPFEEPYDHPEPFDWSGSKVGKVLKKNREEVDACLNGLTNVKVIIYIGRGGKVVASGGYAS